MARIDPNIKFQCPECSSDCTIEGTKYVRCGGHEYTTCTFRCLKSDIWQYMVRIAYFDTKEEYEQFLLDSPQ